MAIKQDDEKTALIRCSDATKTWQKEEKEKKRNFSEKPVVRVLHIYSNNYVALTTVVCAGAGMKICALTLGWVGGQCEIFSAPPSIFQKVRKIAEDFRVSVRNPPP